MSDPRKAIDEADQERRTTESARPDADGEGSRFLTLDEIARLIQEARGEPVGR